MKHIISICLLLCMLLPGCGFKESMKAPVSFYYLRTDLEREQHLVIDSEEREAHGHIDDLNYLVLLYLRGPANEDLYSPFPSSVTLERLTHIHDTLHITLGGIDFSQQVPLDATLSCACLAKTCFALSNVTCVRINTLAGQEAGQQDIIIHSDSLILWDQAPIPTEAIE